MKTALIPPKAKIDGELPRQADVLSRHEAIQEHHDRALGQVGDLLKGEVFVQTEFQE